MRNRPSTVQVMPGDGLVARFGDVVLYTDAQGAAADALLAAVETASAADPPGEGLAAEVAGVVFGPAAAAAVGLAAPTDTGFVVLLHGPVAAIVETREGPRRLTGGQGPAFVSETVAGTVPTVGFSAAAAGPRWPDPRSDLRSGVVPGGGVVMVGDAVRAPSDHIETVAIKPSIVGRDATPDADQAVTRRFAGLGETSVAVSASRALTCPSGASYPLDRAYVIGRAPLSDEAVRTANASPIVVPYDPYVSRVHAYVTVRGAEVLVRDANTASGTYIAAPGAEDWTRLGPEPTRFEPGWSLRVGDWIATYR